MRQKIAISTSLTATALALLTAIADMSGNSSIICSSTACEKVHSSTFATVFNLPVGFYAAAILAVTLILYIRKKEKIVSAVLCCLVGAEAYLTFIAIFYMRSFCTSCLIFFAFLIAYAIATQAVRDKTAVMAGITAFFAAHFFFFFPEINLRPTLIQDVSDPKTIEIFAAPSCPHCEEAIRRLRRLCENTGAELVVRPVSISSEDGEKNVEWISGRLFQCKSPSPISKRIAEKVIWENESDARKLNGGKLAVPIILVKTDDRLRKIYRGWSAEIERSIDLAFGQPEAKASETVKGGGMCTKSGCSGQGTSAVYKFLKNVQN